MALARFSMAPRQGHFKAMQKEFGYLQKYPKGRILIDSGHFDHKKDHPQVYTQQMFDNWHEFYLDAEEELLPDQPESLGAKA